MSNTIYIDKAKWLSMLPKDQVELITKHAANLVSVEIVELPKLNLENIGHLFNQFIREPKLVRVALLSEPHFLSQERVSKLLESLHSIKDILCIKDSINNLTIVPPDAFNILDHYEILKTKVKERSGMERATSLTAVKRLFNIHYKVNIALTIEDYDEVHEVAFQGRNRIRLSRGQSHIQVGCSRYKIMDLEQLALQLGYIGSPFSVTEFPYY